MARRRRRTGRGSAAASRWRIIAVALVVVLVAIALLLDRQFKGYFAGLPPARPSGAPQNSVPQAPGPTLTPALLVPSPLIPAHPRAKVAIIIDDCGYSATSCLPFLRLPIPLTISVLPLTPHGRQIAAAALAAGKYVILHLPMQPESPNAHPGPGAILDDMSDEQIRRQVALDVNFLPDVPGANNHMGSKATSDPRVMADVLSVFKDRHLFFIDSMTAPTTVAATMAGKLGIPTARRDVFLDDRTDLHYIQRQVAILARVALARGTAIAIGHPHPTTWQAITDAIGPMEAQGIEFVPVQSLVR